MLVKENQAPSQQKRNRPPKEEKRRKLLELDEADTQGNKILYHIHQNLLSREINIDKVYDYRQKTQNPAEQFERDTANNFIYSPLKDKVIKIGDIKKMPEIIHALIETLEDEIFQGLQTENVKTGLDRGVQVFEKRTQIIESYHIQKKKME